ncbi:BTNL8 protein, partial [Atractosteus spatula]|nr:BTNL8 protein [Atractosteus spatula]
SFSVWRLKTRDSCVLFLSERFQVHGPADPVVVFPGEDAVLPCYLSPSISAVDLEIRWFRGDYDYPVCLYQNRNYNTKIQNPAYRDRAELFLQELPRGNVSLKLTDVRLSDHGQYKCLVESVDHYEDTLISLAVRDVSVSLHSPGGGQTQLLCRSEGWFPAPAVIWTDKDGHDVTSLSSTTVERDSQGLLSVSSYIPVQQESNIFSCLVRSTQSKADGESQLHIPRDFFSGPSGWMVALCVTAAVTVAASALLVIHVCISVFQCVSVINSVCISVFQCVSVINSVCISVFQCVSVINSVCISVFQCVSVINSVCIVSVINSVCISVFQCVSVINSVCISVFQCVSVINSVCISVFQCVSVINSVCISVFQCVSVINSVCISVFQCVSVINSVCISVFQCVSVINSVCISVFQCVSVINSVCISVFQCVSVINSVCISVFSVSVTNSVCISVFQCVSVINSVCISVFQCVSVINSVCISLFQYINGCAVLQVSLSLFKNKNKTQHKQQCLYHRLVFCKILYRGGCATCLPTSYSNCF